MSRLNFLATTGLCLFVSTALHGQQWLVDTTFHIEAQEQGAISILPLADGKVIVSGRLKWPGELDCKLLVRLESDGTLDGSFYNSSLGGALITPFGEGFYVGTSQTVRKILPNGQQDPTFLEMNLGPYFESVQGGDYHVFPDGRVLMTGAHFLDDTIRGFYGLYNLVWFTNEGYLDTTRIHRRSNGVTYDFEALSNGQFLVYGTGTTYEGQAVGRIFRIHADGSLDPTFQSGMNWGAIRSFLPLQDGRFYAAGIFRRTGFPDDTLRVARFHSNGELDQTFAAPHFAYYDQPNPSNLGPSMNEIQFTEDGNIMIMGNFQLANGVFRKGLCVVDSTGALLDDFSNIGVGRYYWMNIPNAHVKGFLPIANDTAYIYGAYHGCSDGTTNDTLQRFVTRLYAPAFTTVVQEPEVVEKQFNLYPNPAAEQVTITYALRAETTDAFVVIRDAMGRVVLQRQLPSGAGRTTVDTRRLAPGLYAVSLMQGDVAVATPKLLIQ